MKTIIAGVVAAVIAGTASAQGVLSFGFGATIFQINGGQGDEGQNFTLMWAAGEGLALGVYFERSGLLGNGYSNDFGPDTSTIQTVQINKTVLRNVRLVGRLGANTVVLTGSGGPVTVTAPTYEFGGLVTIVTASGEKLTGRIVTGISARYCNPTPNPKADGANVTLIIEIVF